MDGSTLATIIFLALLALALLALGIYQVRVGLKKLPDAEATGQEPVWHKHTNILFGLTNFAFALLLLLLLVLSLSPASLKGSVLALFALVGALSIFLVVRSLLFTLRAARKLTERMREKKDTPGKM